MLILALITVLIGLVGMIWMATIAFTEGDTMWALGCIVLGAIVAPLYGIRNFDICRIPTILCFIGFGGRLLLRTLGT